MRRDPTSSGLRWCSSCKQQLSREAFTPGSKNKDGLDSRCRKCRAEAKRAYRLKNLEQARAKESVQAKARRKENLEKARKYGREYAAAERAINPEKSRKRVAKWSLNNRDKERAIRLAYRTTNADKEKARQAAWAKANPAKAAAKTQRRRVRKIGAVGDYTADDVAVIKAAQKNQCAFAVLRYPWCEGALRKSCHVDHIIPLVGGGTNHPRNLQLLCKPCNVRKSSIHPIDFAQANGALL